MPWQLHLDADCARRAVDRHAVGRRAGCSAPSSRSIACTSTRAPAPPTASGRYDYESGGYTAAVRGTGLQLGRPFVPETLGTLVVDVQFEGSGTLDAPGGSRLHTRRSAGRPHRRSRRRRRDAAAARRRAGRRRAPSCRSCAPSSTPAWSRARRTTCAARGRQPPRRRAAGAGRRRVDGHGVGHGRFQRVVPGRAERHDQPSAFVNLQEVAVSAGGVPVRLERPARIEARRQRLHRRRPALQVGQGTLAARGRFRDPRRDAAAGRVRRSGRRPRGRSAGVVRPGRGRQRLRRRDGQVGEPRRPRPARRHRHGRQRPASPGASCPPIEGLLRPRPASTGRMLSVDT